MVKEYNHNISIHLSVLRFVLWPSIWPILLSIPHILEKMSILLLLGEISYKYQSRQVGWEYHSIFYSTRYIIYREKSVKISNYNYNFIYFFFLFCQILVKLYHSLFKNDNSVTLWILLCSSENYWGFYLERSKCTWTQTLKSVAAYIFA